MGHVTPKVHNAPDRSDWRTPAWFLDLVRQVGEIACDPATDWTNPTGARTFFAALPDPLGAVPANWLGPCGLSAPWPVDGLVFVNPPWGAHLSGPIEPARRIMRQGRLLGIGRGWAERIAAHPGEGLALVPTRTDSAWFGRLHEWADWRLDWRSPELGARLQFVDPDTGLTRGGNNTACSVFYHGPRARDFVRIFGPHGTLVPGERIVRGLVRATLAA